MLTDRAPAVTPVELANADNGGVPSVFRMPDVAFGATIVASASLLFVVQPLISKLILPWFGGTAAVWATSLLFFQCALLGGYLYAHVLASRLSLKRQVAIHLTLLACSLAALPIFPAARWQPAGGADPSLLVLACLATSVGAPYLLLSATSPLVQYWFTHTRRGVVPYRYFALSNFGSLAALLAYPVVIEPALSGRAQVWCWSIAYVAVVLLFGWVGTIVARAEPVGDDADDAGRGPRPGIAIRLLWLALAAAASLLLIGISSLLTENIAPIPLLWVVPLAIYLLTFILCFENDRFYHRGLILPLVLPALLAIAAVAFLPVGTIRTATGIALLCTALFVCAMACHGELARRRPGGNALTAYYLTIACGGAAGGVVMSWVAPHFFPNREELPLMLIFCALALLAAVSTAGGGVRGFGIARQAAAAGTLAVAIAAAYGHDSTLRESRVVVRNFYGPLRVLDYRERTNVVVRYLVHGGISHGTQVQLPSRRNEPVSYFGPRSGIGTTWRILQKNGPVKAAVLGLGAGALAAYGRSGDTIRFFEINPLVIDLAKREFTYLTDSPAKIDIVLGDGRMALASELPAGYDLLVMDAFSGDTVPVHLLTREAFATYWRQLRPDGVLVVNVSNRYLNLAPVVARAARDFGKTAVLVSDFVDEGDEFLASSDYVLVTSRAEFLQDDRLRGRYQAIDDSTTRIWTDDYSSIWGRLK